MLILIVNKTTIHITQGSSFPLEFMVQMYIFTCLNGNTRAHCTRASPRGRLNTEGVESSTQRSCEITRSV